MAGAKTPFHTLQELGGSEFFQVTHGPPETRKNAGFCAAIHEGWITTGKTVSRGFFHSIHEQRLGVQKFPAVWCGIGGMGFVTAPMGPTRNGRKLQHAAEIRGVSVPGNPLGRPATCRRAAPRRPVRSADRPNPQPAIRRALYGRPRRSQRRPVPDPRCPGGDGCHE